MTEVNNGWFALYTHPHKEYMVKEYLESEGLRVYLPEVPNKIQRSDRRPKRPFFPHYMFLLNPGLERLPDIRWIPGIRRVVTFGSRVALVPDEVIVHIEERLRLYQEPEFEPFRQGERIRVTHGPFEGLDVIFDRRLSAKDRVRVFLELISRIQVPVEMDLHDLLPFY